MSFEVGVTRDVLTIAVELPTKAYPSVNHTGADGMRFGKKSEAYKRLFSRIVIAGELAITQGWKPIEWQCDFQLLRYVADDRLRDALNFSKCEADALTKSGVWTDDRWANPGRLEWDVDYAGPDRVVMIIVRRPRKYYEPRAVVKVAKVRTPAVVIPPNARVAMRDDNGVIPPGMARYGGDLIPIEEAHQMLRDGRAH